MKLTTLLEFEVDYFFDVDEFQLPLGKHIVPEFCKKGAIDLTTQRDQRYGFAEFEQPQTTKLTNSR